MLLLFNLTWFPTHFYLFKLVAVTQRVDVNAG